jgi:hypothetical protein
MYSSTCVDLTSLVMVVSSMIVLSGVMNAVVLVCAFHLVALAAYSEMSSPSTHL